MTRIARSLILPCIVLGAVLTAPLVAPEAAWGTRHVRQPIGDLARVRTWAFAIGSGDLTGDIATRYAPFDLVVVDGAEASPGQVAALHRHSIVVLAYLDVGTIEPGRPWFDRAKPFRLGFWKDWGEWFADVSKRAYRDLIANDVAPEMLAKGFDGLFLDNIDMISDHPAQAAGMHLLVDALSQLVHGISSRHEYLFAQNGEDVIGPMLPALDGWNREDVTSTYDFGRHRYVRQPPREIRHALAALRRFRRAGLVTTATDYVATHDRLGASRATKNACAADALPFQSDINLRRMPTAALRCGT